MDIEAAIAGLRDFSTPELCDGMGEFRAMDASIKPRAAYRPIVGPALTVEVPEGEGAIVADAICEAHPGEVIVVAGKGCLTRSYWGDHRSIAAGYQGVEGVVVDGAVRDVDGLGDAGLPVFAAGVFPGTAAKTGAGALRVTVTCAGVTVRPGDLVVADRNGVVVLRPEEVAATLERARAKRDAQAHTVAEMRRRGVALPKIVWPGRA